MNARPDYDHLYEIAESQAGYFSTSQARQAGFSWERLSNSVKSGKFLRIARGVYRLTHFPGSPYEDLFTAWLMTGAKSTVSHESALAVYELSDILPGEVHLIVPPTASRRHKGIHLHTNQLSPDETTTRAGLPITTVARTIADVANHGMAKEQVLQAIQEALRRGLVSQEELSIHAKRRGGRARQIIREIILGEVAQ